METILIIANSGRMLAQAAKNIGLKPLVIDLFADVDTQNVAEDFRRISSLAESDLAPAVDDFVARYAVKQVIYGSGFEYYPESLRYLASRLIILGNAPDVFLQLHNKPAFFAALDALAIPHPEVAFAPPDIADGWLVKPKQGQGGVGIRSYRIGDGADHSLYWQKFQAGTPHSVLFLAEGRRGQVIGFNSQYCVSLSDDQAFVFSGVINSADLPDIQQALITDWVQQLIPALSLKGLNSLDFIHAEGGCYVLEINPRPSASMQLYAEDLLILHIQACAGEISNSPYVQAGYSGYQLLYAEQDLTIPEPFEWPEECMDLPAPGSFIGAGQPVCSIIAHQKKPPLVIQQLHIKQQLIINKLERF
ncbi:MAG: ATP-grasp domain-containing protein [Methylobacter sp.]|nr:ATP-grasp domain-containing protein [Methylobacter sp.]